MAALQRVASSVSATASNYGSCKAGAADVVVSDQFPVGLRVLVVDDDTTCLKILEQMLRRCLYHVTTCSQAKVALNLLRERKGCFDVVLSDVHMPDMDGYKLLEHVGLEMDLPVIKELKNIWQHVVRKKWHENKELEHSGSLEDNDRNKRGNDDTEIASSVNEGTDGVLKGQKKRSISKDEDDGEPENDDPSTSKKPRVVWSVELHQQFVSAVNQLGIDKAVPKRILELMNVPGLTRENVASHLQKFRLYLKRLSGVAQQGGISNAFCGPMDSNVKLNSLGRFDIQALAASGQIPPQTLAALHAELLGRPAGSLVATLDQPALVQASIQGPKCIPVEHGVSFGQPLVKCQSNISKPFPQNMVSVELVTSGLGAWTSNTNPGDGNLKTTVVVNGYSAPGSISPSASSCSVNADSGITRQVQNSAITFGAARHLPGLDSNICDILCSYGAKSGEVLDQGPLRNLGFVGKGTRLPSRFAVEEFEAPINNLSHGKIYVENSGSKVKQEPNMEYLDVARVGIPVLQQFPPNDLMSVFTE
ncbi:hypothetical protein GH714_007124 [Hevea brasiliensis]|uniref:Two-component response regulator n=1 Tax=Hevea brasiliensis TaxID=3981 RepID=A0A6A6LZF4_HEVBR|nr:hypothetical protein GH714_007124 [Hevea brasiliensis]